jgi:hypothetical protein
MLGGYLATWVDGFNSQRPKAAYRIISVSRALGRLVRKTKRFAKTKRRLVCFISLFQFYWNFINEFERGESPATLKD